MADHPYIGSIEDSDAVWIGGEPCEFSTEDLTTLKAIESGSDIKTVKTGAMWTDDHCPCIEVEVNGVQFSALWLVPEFLADIIYAAKDSEMAKDPLASYIKDQLENYTGTPKEA